MISALALSLLPVTSCAADDPVAVHVEAIEGSPSAAVVRADEVSDLSVVDADTSTLTLTWTQVDDGTGEPAWYRVRYATPPITWADATPGCGGTVKGDSIGAPISCVIEGLEADTPYEAQMMSYRNGKARGASSVYSNVANGRTEGPSDGTSGVRDLVVGSATDSSLSVQWTQVDDGTGEPASYRVKYATPPIDWSEATTACALSGDGVGAEMSCTMTGLAPESTYDVQLVSYRVVDGMWQDPVYSNVATGRTTGLSTPEAPSGIWLGPAEVAALPLSGPAWDNLLSEAQGSCGAVDLSDQNQTNNVCVMAKALVFARTGNMAYATDVLAALGEVASAPVYDGRALALGRELGAYAIAADLIDLATLDAALDTAFRSTLRTLLTTFTHSGPENLIDCHERRPNNWGTHCGGARAAVAAYLGDRADLDRVAQVFKGWLGDRSSYAGFSFGDLSWQCDADRPVGINPVGCERDGHPIGGVLPDDQRRSGSFTWPPPRENYVWEALQGALMQAVILHRAGYPAFEWGDRALLRAVTWLHDEAGYPAEGDDTWQTHLINHFYGTSFPAITPARAGKNVGWTDWTHGG